LAGDAKTYYETYWSEQGFCPTGRIVPPVQALFEKHIPAAAECLDVGCGDGRTSGLWLAGSGRSYAGVDVSSAAVEMARSAGLEAQVIEDAAQLPFADASFDAVVCIEVLEHLFGARDAATEMARILRPGGVAIISVPNIAYWRRRVDFALLGRWNPMGDARSVSEPWRDPHIRFFNRGILRRMLLDAGFEGVSVKGYGGTVLGDIPVLRRLCRRHGGWAVPDWRPNPVYAAFERAFPSLFGYRLCAVARR
jgi:2-polyprenyl-6-hydroxyphenyl methylase/3-demethylubiquinone-9 3-methyltransferase